MSEHIVSSYDAELQDLRRRISEMGGIAEKMLVDAIAALVRRDTPLAQAVIAADARLDVLQREVEEQRHPDHRPAPAAGHRPARDHLGHPRLAATWSASATSRRTSRKRALAIGGAVPAAEDRRRRPAHGRSRPRPAQGRARRLCAAGYGKGPRRLAAGWRHRRALYLALPRAPDLHDGRSAQHLVLHASSLLRQEHRAHRRPHHQHRRDGPLSRHGRDAGHRPAEGRPVHRYHRWRPGA